MSKDFRGAGLVFGLVTKHAWQTDGQNYDSRDRASIAASRGKNESQMAAFGVIALTW